MLAALNIFLTKIGLSPQEIAYIETCFTQCFDDKLPAHFPHGLTPLQFKAKPSSDPKSGTEELLKLIMAEMNEQHKSSRKKQKHSRQDLYFYAAQFDFLSSRSANARTAFSALFLHYLLKEKKVATHLNRSGEFGHFYLTMTAGDRTVIFDPALNPSIVFERDHYTTQVLRHYPQLPSPSVKSDTKLDITDRDLTEYQQALKSFGATLLTLLPRVKANLQMPPDTKTKMATSLSPLATQSPEKPKNFGPLFETIYPELLREIEAKNSLLNAKASLLFLGQELKSLSSVTADSATAIQAARVAPIATLFKGATGSSEPALAAAPITSTLFKDVATAATATSGDSKELDADDFEVLEHRTSGAQAEDSDTDDALLDGAFEILDEADLEEAPTF